MIWMKKYIFHFDRVATVCYPSFLFHNGLKVTLPIKLGASITIYQFIVLTQQFI